MNLVSQTRDRGHLICLVSSHWGHTVGSFGAGSLSWGPLAGSHSWTGLPLGSECLAHSIGVIVGESGCPGELKLGVHQSCHQEGQRIILGLIFLRFPHILSGELWNVLVGQSGEQCHLVSVLHNVFLSPVYWRYFTFQVRFKRLF